MPRNTFERFGLESKDKLVIELLEEIRDQLVEANDNLRKLLGARPSPS